MDTNLFYCNLLYLRDINFHVNIFCMIYVNDCSIRVVQSSVNLCKNFSYKFWIQKLFYAKKMIVVAVVCVAHGEKACRFMHFAMEF